MKYEKTKDPNVIKQIETVESKIYIDRLKQEIADLENQINEIPKEKIKPDQETLDCWNSLNRVPVPEELEMDLQKKQDLLKKIQEL